MKVSYLSECTNQRLTNKITLFDKRDITINQYSLVRFCFPRNPAFVKAQIRINYRPNRNVSREFSNLIILREKQCILTHFGL